MAELAGGAEVVFLQEVEGEEGRGDEGGDVGASRGDDGGLGEDGEEAVDGGPGGDGETVVYEGHVLAEAVKGHAAVCCREEVEGCAWDGLIIDEKRCEGDRSKGSGVGRFLRENCFQESLMEVIRGSGDGEKHPET